MSAEPILAFFLMRYLQNTLRTTDPTRKWDLLLRNIMYGIIVLFVIEAAFPTATFLRWIWQLFLIGLIYTVFTREKLRPARPVFLAISPIAVLFLLEAIIRQLSSTFYHSIRIFFDFAYPFSIIWMITMLINARKQRKALDKERKFRLEEEEKSRFIAAQKTELETLVAERTMEITRQKEDLENALSELKETQNQLIQKEKMASLGELTAGIAHEIQNPLNFVNNFSEVNIELAVEIKEKLNHIHLLSGSISDVNEIHEDLINNKQKISQHGKRADIIIKSMLQHSRASSGQKEPTDINLLTDEYLRLSYHGMKARDKSFSANMVSNFDPAVGRINIIPQDIGRVLLNLFNNAFYSVHEKKKMELDGYIPTVTIQTKKLPDKLEIHIKDNGTGIPEHVRNKIFQPFFTTKPAGEGTGLGLSLSYEIITKEHGGELKVTTCENEFAEFLIQLPLN